MRTHMQTQRALGLVLLAFLTLVLSAAFDIGNVQAAVENLTDLPSQPDTGGEPCFIFPPGISWSLGLRGYHDGCEDWNHDGEPDCVSSGSVMGWDYLAPYGTPILAPFDGIAQVSMDRLGNSVLKITNGVDTFGSLHQIASVQSGEEVKAGEQVGIVAAVGRANGIAHSHVWFYREGEGNVEDHSQYWSCIDGRLPEEVGYRKLGIEALSEPSIEALTWFSQLTSKDGWFNWLVKVYKVDWGKIGAFLVALIGVCLLFYMVNSLWGIKLRWVVLILGLGLVIYAKLLPSNEVWLSKPVAGEVTQHYGDPRRDPRGYSGISYAVAEREPVYAVATGEVIFPNSSLFAKDQIWMEIGNGLFVQYEGLTGIQVESGRVRRGEVIGYAFPLQEVRFGVSSKHPDDFVSPDERGLGWIDPAEYLGRSVMSGRRREESIWMQVGLILVSLGLFWPEKQLLKWLKLLGKDLPYPWGLETAYRQSIILAVASSFLMVGWYVKSPYLLFLSVPSLIAAIGYFIGRFLYRWSVRKGMRITPDKLWWQSARYRLLGVFTWAWVGWLVLAMVANPKITYAQGNEYLLELPERITASLPVPEGVDPENSQETFQYEWSQDSVLPEFTITYWNGAEVRFYAPVEVWNAVVTASEKYSYCDPVTVISVAHSESPVYKNYNTENSATAMGTFQFIRSTWGMMWKDQETIPPRTDINAAADAACRYLKMTGVFEAQTKQEFIDAFAITPLVWNQYPPQADYVWRLINRIYEEME